ncbi:AAA family ATPase [uncultured Alsobacter sp.]|uniref:AAA family ATPase n=1 Tax=uncultured Alsobacter sp. TaxID=1748258 RepID=UPI0025FEFF29|nr:AAA family ATPase [uncultured Alsobacter sp.]
MENVRADAPEVNIDGAVEFLESVECVGRIAVACIDPSGINRTSGETFTLPFERPKLRKWLSRHNGTHNLYFRTNEPKPVAEQTGARGCCNEDDISLIRAISVDLDPIASVEATPGGLERERARLHTIADEWREHFVLSPTFIVDSGAGIQMHWRFEEPLPNTVTNRAAVKAQARGLQELFGPGADKVQSVEHLFRIPFTVNIPNAGKIAKGRTATAARLIHADPGSRYTLAGLSRFVQPLEAPEVSPAIDRHDFDFIAVLDAAEAPETMPEHLKVIAADLRRIKSVAVMLAGDADRSKRDFHIACLCVERGLSEATEIGQVTFSLSPAKLLEKEEAGRGEQYALYTVSRALQTAKPRLTKDVFSDESQAALQAPQMAPAPADWDHLDITFPIDVKSIKRREWLASGATLNIPDGEPVLLAGPPKVSKSAFVNGLALSVASGDPVYLFGQAGAQFCRFKAGRVLIVNNEDTRDEILRRLAAITNAAGRAPATGKLKVWAGGDAGRQPLRVLQREQGRLTPGAGYDQLRSLASHFQPNLIVFDSLASMSIGLSENDNAEMDLLVRTLAEIAALSRATALIIHHTSKSKAGSAGDQTAARGAGALYGAVRAGLTLMPVSEEDAEAAQLPPGHHVRLDDSGGNYSAKDDKAQVFSVYGGDVGNGEEEGSRPRDAASVFHRAPSDKAAVLRYIGAFKFGARGPGKRGKQSTGGVEDGAALPAMLARAISNVLGEEAEMEFKASVKERVGAELVARGYTGGVSVSAIDKLAREHISASGVEIEEGGQLVLIYRRPKSKTAKSQTLIGREVRSIAGEGGCDV